MKKNNKGFMLVEVIIVSVVVAVIMTTLYVTFNRVYNSYRLKETYTDVDAIYAIKTIEDHLVDEMTFNSLLNNNDEVKEIFCNEKEYCKNIFTQYNINKIYLLKLNAANENRVPDLSGVNQTFKDYIVYLNNAIKFDNSVKYIFVLETYEIDLGTDAEKNILNKYAYLEVK